ncbi:MAG: hypothetical protein UU93_C0007G0025 [Candidatus Amesbacteria bacterium GW2011_GWA2_42_12]|uniref:Core-binding (CB) domain-containing protein n=1 Tax=Candidatus Amesbacteria bacterium GW2011_GWA2_42_12 TaxID=1618356 RepID=A0A0G0Y6P0_9BACT|nr:MAG: hypothetical protein UU93_C0007G0025 [Candidatus Amesbacteria bacterium GW2011_GWA2_42_12]
MNNITPIILQNSFLDQLSSHGLNGSTQKNYKSDITNFFVFLKESNLLSDSPNQSDIINQENVVTYKEWLLKSSPVPTVNRRLSTIRKFISFSYTSNFIPQDFSNQVFNISISPKVELSETEKLLKKYADYLSDHQISSNSIKNYLSDTKLYLTGNNTVNKSPATLKRYQSSIKKFKDWQNNVIDSAAFPKLLNMDTQTSIADQISIPPILPRTVFEEIYTAAPKNHRHQDVLVWILLIVSIFIVCVLSFIVIRSLNKNIPLIDPSPSIPTISVP